MIVLPGPVVKGALGRPLTGAMLPTDIGLFPSAESHFINRRVGVSQAILIYCVRGEGWAEVNGRRCAVREEQVLIMPPSLPHSYGADDERPWTIYWCHVAGHSVPDLLNALSADKGGPTVMAGDSRALVPLFERIIATLKADYSRPSLVTASLVLGHLFGELIASQRKVATPADLDERLESVLSFMRQQISGTIRLNELAAMARLSPSHFAAMFKRKTGYTVLDYFTRLKIQEACALLQRTGLPIKLISQQLAYEDPLYFSRVFQRVMGMSAKQYRRTNNS